LTIVGDAIALSQWVAALLHNPERRQAMAECAAASVRRHGDLPRRITAALLELLPARSA
jgi:hypothetical protein